MGPQAAANQDEQVMEAGMGFGIPSGLEQRDLTMGTQGVCHQDDKGEKAKKSGSRAFNRQVTPLTLRFDTQMGPGFFKGDFMGPAFDKISDNGGSRLMDIC
jgi:hypothetical protein